jgi:hypothetical protein
MLLYVQDVPTRAFNDKGRDHLPSPTPPAAAAGPGTLGKVVLPSQLLMEALNEHVGDGQYHRPCQLAASSHAAICGELLQLRE